MSENIDIEFLNDLKRSVYTESYYEFFKWSFSILLPNDKLEDNFHIKYLCDLLQDEQERIERREEKKEDIIVNIPPRSTKTMICSVSFPVWVWVRMPTARFITVSFDDTLSLKNAQDSRDLINSNEFQELFGKSFKLRTDANAKGFYFNDKGGYRLSKTTGSNITGHSGLYLIVDDPQNPKTAESEIERDNVKNYYRQSLYNRLTPINLGLRLIIMQRLHTNDLTGNLLINDEEEYRHINLPARESDAIRPIELREKYTKGLFDPIRLSDKVLNGFNRTLGTTGYAAQYDQDPRSGDGNIFKESWFEIVEPSTITRDPINEPIHFTIDTAYTAKKENDPSGILSFFIKNNSLYILDARDWYLEFPELQKEIIRYTSMSGYTSNSSIGVEPKASGKSIVQNIRSLTMLNIFETESPDTDKVTRAHSITPYCEFGRVKLVKGQYIEKFLAQLTAFPKVEHDEFVDILVIAVNEFLVKHNPDYFFV